MERKSSTYLYRLGKEGICWEHYHNGDWASTLLLRARAGALDTREMEWKIGGEGVDLTCGLCGEGEETLEHVLLDCEGLADLRWEVPEEDDKEIIMSFMLGLNKCNNSNIIEKTKGLLVGWWERRGGAG